MNRSGRAGCLDDDPDLHVNYTDYPTGMPGVLVDGDKQCEYQYGPGNKACRTYVSLNMLHSKQKQKSFKRFFIFPPPSMVLNPNLILTQVGEGGGGKFGSPNSL